MTYTITSVTTDCLGREQRTLIYEYPEPKEAIEHAERLAQAERRLPNERLTTDFVVKAEPSPATLLIAREG